MAINAPQPKRVKIVVRTIAAGHFGEANTADEVENDLSKYINDGWRLFSVHPGRIIQTGEIPEAFVYWYHLVKD